MPSHYGIGNLKKKDKKKKKTNIDKAEIGLRKDLKKEIASGEVKIKRTAPKGFTEDQKKRLRKMQKQRKQLGL